MSTNRPALIAAAFLLPIAIAGCGTRTLQNPESDADCRPGETRTCTCTDGTGGTQTCDDDRTWELCRCGDAGTDDTGRDAADSDDRRDAGDEPSDTDGDAGTTDSDTAVEDAGDDDANGADAVEDDAGSDDPIHPLRSVRADSPFEREVAPPTCDDSRSEVKTIDEKSDWADINSGDYRVFCVKPGNYRGAEPKDDANRITITASGSSEQRRYILYDGPSDAHPANRDSENRAIIDGLDFAGGSGYWTVRGLQIHPGNSSGGGTEPVEVHDGSSNQIFDRLLVSAPDGEFVDTYAVEFWGDDNTFQNSVVRNLLGEAGEDRYCTEINGQTEGTRVVSNELYNCTDGIQLAHVTDNPDFTDTVVAHNDMYITPRYFSDGNGNRGSDNSGDWTCAENAVDIKAGSSDDAEPVQIVGNRMWNFSDADTECGSSGTGPRANAITIHNKGNENGATTEYIDVRSNIIFDVESGVGITWSNQVTVENNLLSSYGYKGADEGFEANEGRGFLTYESDNVAVDGNTFVDGKTWGSVKTGDTVTDNVFIDAGGLSGKSRDGTTSGNAYYGDSEPWEDSPDIQETDVSRAAMKEFCVTLRGYTDPREKCFERGLPTSESPHGEQTGFNLPER